MKVLVINAGSSSLKYQLIDISHQELLAKGMCERIGFEDSIHTYSKADGFREESVLSLHNQVEAIDAMLKMLTDPDKGVIVSMDEIEAIGHRIVHGGEAFNKSTMIDNNVLEVLRQCIDLAPIHNPANIMGIEACRQEMPNIPMVGVFDTAFHQTMPPKAFIYALPYDLYKKYGIRKYGFHGTSHKYVMKRAAAMLGKPVEELKLVSCHLGNGASICAIEYGKSIDTSMGFTPLSGLAMGTRSGTIDPALIAFIMEKESMTIEETNTFLNRKSGVLGISGISSDFRDLLKASSNGNMRAKLAIEVFAYRVKKYVAEYIGIMNGADAIIFTAGIGENNNLVRKLVTDNMDYAGIKCDPVKNISDTGREMDISTDDSPVRILVIPTNEEMEIALEVKKVLSEIEASKMQQPVG
ncbi:MAG TPA: acetate kinase [Clostridia bacterium]|nr:acetate kinase [Clostridia bacterium]